MRIIAGAYKGKRLVSLDSKGLNIRPTSDMAREALFSVLARWPKGSFLDLFSGTGAVALEALSRGYSPVWCVERNKSALASIRANGSETCLNIIQKDARDIKAGYFCDVSVIFADPPYDKTLEMWDAMAERLRDFLSQDGVLVWECPKTADLSKIPGLTNVCEKRYGAAKFLFFNAVNFIHGVNINKDKTEFRHCRDCD